MKRKKIGKRICSILLAATMFSSTALLASGCTSSDSSSKSAKSTSSAPGKLSGSITVCGWNQAASALKANAKQFMTENPGTTVTVQTVDSDYTKLYSELAANSGVPDVVTIQNRDVKNFVNKYPDSWLDLTDMMKPEESNFSNYVRGLAMVDNKYYAVPWDLGPCALYYRKDIFKEAGVDPSTIKTYDDYIAAGKKIVTKTGGKTKLIGFDYSGSTSTDMPAVFFSQLGGQYYNKNGKVQLNSDAMVKAVDLCKKMINAGVAVNLPNEWNDRISAATNDQIASIPYAVWYAGTLQAISDQKGKWGIMPLPAFTVGGNTQANEGGSALAISSQTKNAELAKAFVKFALMSSEGNKINFETSKLFTSYQKSYKDSEYTATDDYFGISIGSTFAKLSTNIPTVDFGPHFTDVNNALKTGIGNALLKKQDTKAVLKEASDTAQKAIDNE